MRFFYQIARSAVHGVPFVLLVLVGIDGVPVAASMACQRADAPCVEQVRRHNHCPTGAALSCLCQDATVPVTQASSRVADLVTLTRGSAVFTDHSLDLATSRLDYAMAGARLRVPLPILHASLLI